MRRLLLLACAAPLFPPSAGATGRAGLTRPGSACGRIRQLLQGALLASLVSELLGAPIDVQVLPEPEFLVARDVIARRMLLIPWTPGRVRNLGSCPQ